MRAAFDEKLLRLRTRVHQLAWLDLKLYLEMLKSLDAGSRDYSAVSEAETARAARLFAETDRQALLMILCEQPVASDLATITLMQGVSPDLNRIAAQIRELVLLLEKTDPGLAGPMLLPLARQTGRMLRSAVDAISRRSAGQAARVIREDDTTDSMFESVRESLSHDRVPDRQDALNLLMAAKYLERIADHAGHMAGQLLSLEDTEDKDP